MLRSGVVSIADLRGCGHDVAFVDSVFARSTVVPAVVPDVEETAEPCAVLGFSALDPLVVQGASADLDPAFACASLSSALGCTFARAFGALTFAFLALALSSASAP